MYISNSSFVVFFLFTSMTGSIFPPRLRSSREKLADRKITIRSTRFFQTETRQHKRRLGTWNLFILKQRALSAIFRWIHYQFLFFAFFYAPVLIPLLLTYYVLYLSEDTKASDVFFLSSHSCNPFTPKWAARQSLQTICLWQEIKKRKAGHVDDVRSKARGRGTVVTVSSWAAVDLATAVCAL